MKTTLVGGAGRSVLHPLPEPALGVHRGVHDAHASSNRIVARSARSSGGHSGIRNVFHKLDVSSRVDVARVIERADRAAGNPTSR